MSANQKLPGEDRAIAKQIAEWLSYDVMNTGRYEEALHGYSSGFAEAQEVSKAAAHWSIVSAFWQHETDTLTGLAAHYRQSGLELDEPHEHEVYHNRAYEAQNMVRDELQQEQPPQTVDNIIEQVQPEHDQGHER